MRATSATRRSPSITLGAGDRLAADDRLGDGDLGVGDGGDLGEVGDDEHLVRLGHGGEGLADRRRRGPADPGVDLVEDQRRRSPSAARLVVPIVTRRSASIVRASSPPDATLLSGSSGIPGFAESRNCTSSSDSTCDVDDGVGHRQHPQPLRHGRTEAWRRRRAGRRAPRPPPRSAAAIARWRSASIAAARCS